MRTTYGRVSRAGGVTLSWSLDKVGPMCRSADDCGLVLAAIAGYDPADPATVHRPFVYSGPPPATKRYRIAIVKGSYENAQPEVRANFEASWKVLAQFADLTHDVELPDYPYAPILSTVMGAEAAAAFQELIETGQMREMANQQDRLNGYARTMISAVDYLQAMRVRKPARLAMDKFLAQYDAVIGPTSGSVAASVHGTFAGRGDSTPKPGEAAAPRAVALTGPGNVVGVPALSVPNGFGQNNLPSGMQFMGSAWSEKTLIDIAVQYQKRTDWNKRRPPIEKWMRSETGPAPRVPERGRRLLHNVVSTLRIELEASMSLDRRQFLSSCSKLGFASTLLPGALFTIAAKAEGKRITAEMIDQAALIADIKIADDQKAAMLSILNTNLKGFEEFRR